MNKNKRNNIAKEYFVAVAGSPIDLECIVNEKMALGFDLQGGVSFSNWNSVKQYCQALVRLG